MSNVARAPRESWKVLIVDDTPGDRDELRRLLQVDTDRAYSFLDASSGSEGLGLCDDITCLILDYDLPAGDALSMLAAMRDGRPRRRAPVVAIADVPTRSAAAAAMRAGAMEFLGRRRLSPECLNRAVENAIDRFSMMREMHEAETLLRQAMHASDAGSWKVIPATGRFIASDRAMELHGLVPGSPMTNERAAECVHPDDRAAVEATLRRTVERGEPLYSEHRVRLPDGSIRWVASQGERTVEGDETSVVGLVRDITDRKEADEQARANLDAMTRLQKLASMYLTDGDLGPVLGEVVEAAIEITGADFGNIQLVDAETGRQRIVAQRGFPQWWVDFWNGVEGRAGACGAAIAASERVIIDDVRAHPLFVGTAALDAQDRVGVRAVQSTPLLSRSRQVVGVFSTHYRTPRRPDERALALLDLLARQAADIIARDGSESVVRRNAQTFSALVEQSPLGIYTVDSQFRIRNVSVGAMPAFRNVRPLIGRDFGEAMRILWPEPVASEVIAVFRRVIETGDAYVSPGLTERREDIGTIESYEWQVNRVTLADGRDGAVCYFFDSTRLQQVNKALTESVEEQRQLERALQHADRQKDQFLATLAHELRNPLAPIRNALYLMRTRGPAATPNLIDLLERQVNNMVRLVDDLMEVSRISRGLIELRREPVDLRSVLSAAVETSRPLIERAQQRLSVSVPDAPLLMQGDEVRLTQVFANLLNNAAKYTDKGGRIDVTAWREGGRAMIEVVDDGIGIAADQLPWIFDMFAQVDRGAARSQGGLGIGLSLVQRLVRMHGGDVAASSEGVGHGSRFKVWLPLSSEVTSEPRPTSPLRTAALSSLRVMVVDDNRDAAESLGEVLRSMGAEVRIEHDGEAALSAIDRGWRPSLVLLDLGMPRLDGYEVARRIRARAAGGERITLVAVTGWGLEKDRERSQAAGFDHHFTKPVDIQRLHGLISSLVEARDR